MSSLRMACLVVALLGLLACGSEAPEPNKKKAQPDKPAAVAKVEQKAVAPVEPATEEAPFVYDPKGLRDPFEPFVKLETKKKEKPKIITPRTPLQRYAVEELRVVGIVWADGGKAKALIEDPEGKGYVVGIGTLVGDQEGRIIRIHPEKVVVEERIVDLLGEENVKVVALSLHKPEDEVSR